MSGPVIKLRCANWGQLATIYERDLKKGTLFVRTGASLPLGREARIDIVMPTGSVVTVEGRVAHIVPSGERGAGMELVLNKIPPSGMWLIESALARAPAEEDDTISDDESASRAEAELLAALEGEMHSLRTMNPHQVLGIEYNATEADARAAFAELSKRYHPDRFARFESPRARQLAADIFVVLREAYRRIAEAAGRPLAGPPRSTPARGVPVADSAVPVPIDDQQGSVRFRTGTPAQGIPIRAGTPAQGVPVQRSGTPAQGVPIRAGTPAQGVPITPSLGPPPSPSNARPRTLTPGQGVPFTVPRTLTPGQGVPLTVPRPTTPGAAVARAAGGTPAQGVPIGGQGPERLPPPPVPADPARPPMTPSELSGQVVSFRPTASSSPAPPAGSPLPAPRREPAPAPAAPRGSGLDADFLFGDLGAAPAAPTPLSIDDPRLIEADNLLASGKLDQALAIYEDTVRDEPTHRAARAGRELVHGMRKSGAGDREGAVQHFEAALDIEPWSERAARELAGMRRAATERGKGLLSKFLRRGDG